MRLAILPAMIVLSVCAAARAQSGATDSSQKPTPAGSPVKQPPAPLFPKSRRGIYRNSQGLDVVDAVPQSPPLETDDPSVPDKGDYEINLTTHADFSNNVQNFDLLQIDANYGVLPRMAGHELPTQLKFEFPLAAARTSGDPLTVGVGAAIFGLKFNFYNNEGKGAAVSFYPQLEFTAPGSRGVEKGLAEPGQTLILPLLVAKIFHDFVVVANGAAQKPIHDPERELTGAVGLGFGRAITRKVSAMVEIRGESTFDLARDRLMSCNLGLIHGVRNVVVFAQVGHTLYSDDGNGHTYVGAGLKVLIQPNKK